MCRTVRAGRAGNLPMKLLIGMPYGPTYEIMGQDGALRLLTRKEINVDHCIFDMPNT